MSEVPFGVGVRSWERKDESDKGRERQNKREGGREGRKQRHFYQRTESERKKRGAVQALAAGEFG